MREFPPQPLYPEPSYLVCVPQRLIPLFCGALSNLEKRDVWASDDDWRQGYQWIIETQANLMSGCVDEIIDIQKKTYRLLDTALNGAAYTVATPATETTPAEITPAIPDVPANEIGASPGLRRQLLDAQGILPGSWPFGLRDRSATMADVVKALRIASEGDKNTVKDTIDLLNDASEVATIAGTVKGFVEAAADGTLEAGSLILQAMSTVGNMAMLRLLLESNLNLRDRLDRLIASLDGGATPPATNVIAELQATNEALA